MAHIQKIFSTDLDWVFNKLQTRTMGVFYFYGGLILPRRVMKKCNFTIFQSMNRIVKGIDSSRGFPGNTN
jgi:hypothetical protein